MAVTKYHLKLALILSVAVSLLTGCPNPVTTSDPPPTDPLDPPVYDMEITLRATEQDLEDGKFLVLYKALEPISEASLFFGYRPLDPDMRLHCLVPYVDPSQGTVVSQTADQIEFSFSTADVHEYGYYVTPKPGYFGSGYVTSESGIWDLFATLDQGKVMTTSSSVLRVELPAGMTVFTPYEPLPNDPGSYLIRSDDSFVNYIGEPPWSLVTWSSSFDHADSITVSGKTLNVLALDTAIPHTTELLKDAFYLGVQAFDGAEILLNDVTNIVFVPDNGSGQAGPNYGAITEGWGGFYNPSWAESAYNDGQLAAFYSESHGVAHATLNVLLVPWLAEGPAEYHETMVAMNSGIISVGDRTAYYRDLLSQYEGIIAAGEDLSLDSDPWGQPNGSFVIYHKSNLVLLILQELISAHAPGHDLFDFWVLYHQWVASQIGETTFDPWSRAYVYGGMISVLEALTSLDFDPFFADYVIGTEPLPISWDDVNGAFVITYP